MIFIYHDKIPLKAGSWKGESKSSPCKKPYNGNFLLRGKVNHYPILKIICGYKYIAYIIFIITKINIMCYIKYIVGIPTMWGVVFLEQSGKNNVARNVAKRSEVAK